MEPKWRHHLRVKIRKSLFMLVIGITGGIGSGKTTRQKKIGEVGWGVIALLPQDY
jgi:uridine kinase